MDREPFCRRAGAKQLRRGLTRVYHYFLLI